MPIISPTAISPHNRRGINWSSYWTQQYQDVLDYLTAESIAEPSNTDKLHQAKWVKRLVDAGLWAKAEFIDLFATPLAMSLINWKSPGTFNPIAINNPSHDEYCGYRGYGTSGINLKFRGVTDATLTSQNNICLIIGVGDNITFSTEDTAVYETSKGALALRSGTNGNAYFRANDGGSQAVANANTIKYLALSRNAAATFDAYVNKTKSTKTQASSAVADLEMYACGQNYLGTFTSNPRVLRFVCRFSYLTEAEIGDFIDITEEYLTAYRSNLISPSDYIAKPYYATREILPVDTYDGSDETIHPAVVDCGAAWNGYRYWMANTPYPSDNNYENPSIWASNDGKTWVVPDGLTNPVIAKPATGFNADTDLILENNTLYMSYMEVLGGVTYNVKQTHSTDGVTWSAPVLLNTHTKPRASGTILKIGGRFYLYYYTTDNNVAPYATARIERISCDTIDGTYANVEAVTVPKESKHFWYHPHVFYYNGYYYLTSVASTAGGSGTRIMIFKSSDGINFTKAPYHVLSLDYNALSISDLYRPCISTIGTQTVLYCSLKASAKWALMVMNIDLL